MGVRMKRAGQGLMVLLATGVLVALAWLASNGRWADAPPRPLPLELQLRPVALAPAHNGFYDLQGLEAPAGEAANAWGRLSLSGEAPEATASLAWPSDPLWSCRSEKTDCVTAWRAERERMAALRAGVAALGARCEALAQRAGIEEVLPQRPATGPQAALPWAALPLPRFANLTHCLRWFGLGAVLADDAAQARALLARGDQLARQALAGSRSLIGAMVGLAGVRRHWLLAAQLAAAQPGDHRAALLALLDPLPGAALSPRAWVPHELHFQREILRDLVDRRGCADPVAQGFWLDRLACSWQLGLLPEATAQANQDRWLQRLAGVPADGPARCEALAAPAWADAQGGLRWRNTLGRWLLDTADQQWPRYPARQLDLELLRQTLRAQLLGQSLPAAVQLTRQDGAQTFAACQARLDPGEAGATLRLPLL